MKYDAFLSYSHAADGKLCPAVQTALHRFAKPYFARPTINVFRDRANLSATPHLWGSIETALADSEWFVLLASPAAAESPWIQREVEWWLAHRSPDRILVLLTSGEVQWDTTAADFDWTRTTALPRDLAGRFTGEPGYVDLRWAHRSEQLSLRHSQFRGAMLDVISAIRGVDKINLDGEDVRQYRRNIRLRNAGVALLVAFASVAFWQAISARRAQTRAEQSAREAARQQQIAEESAREAARQTQVARDAATAEREARQGEQKATRVAQEKATEAQRQQRLAEEQQHRAEVEQHRAQEQEQVAVSERGRAEVQRRRAELGEAQARQNAEAEAAARRQEHEARIEAETRDLASRASTILDSRPQLALLLAAQAVEIARDEGHQPAAYVRTVLADIVRHVQSFTLPIVAPAFVSSTDSGLVLAAAGNDVRVWTVSQSGALSQIAALPAGGAAVEHPNQGRWLVAGRADSVTLFDLTARHVEDGRSFRGRYVSMSADGKWLVTASTYRLLLWNLDTAAPEPIDVGPFSGSVQSVAFSSDAKFLVTPGSAQDAVLWDLSAPRSEPARLVLGFSLRTARFSPDRHWVMMANSDASEGGGSTVLVWDLHAIPPAQYELQVAKVALAEFNDTSEWLAVVGWNDAYQDKHVSFFHLPPDQSIDRYTLTYRNEETNSLEFRKNWMATGSRFEGYGLLWDLALLDDAFKIGHGMGDRVKSRELTQAIVSRLIAPQVLATDQRGFLQVSLLPDGRSVVTRDTSERLQLFELQEVGRAKKVWQLKPGSPIVLRGHERPILTCAVQRRTGVLVTAAQGEPARVWLPQRFDDKNVTALSDLQQLLQLAAREAGRNMTPDEWKQYLPGRDYRPTFRLVSN